MKNEVSLNQYGFSFQVKVLSLLLKDENFFQQIYDILDENYFDGGANQWLVKAIREYFEKYGAVPTIEALKILINDQC